MSRHQIRSSISPVQLQGSAALVSLTVLAIFLALVPTAQAQTLTVLHNLTGGVGGDTPLAGVTLDRQGRIYGTTESGGSHQHGMVYRLAHQGEGWVFSPIYSFGSQEHDGSTPQARVLFGPEGLLYGTTDIGGAENWGTVFSLQPSASACKAVLCPWVETVLYSFTGGADGKSPFFGDLVFDQAGNIYGTTYCDDAYTAGTVFKLSYSNGSWTNTVLHNFTGGADGGFPYSNVVIDANGNAYGTTLQGGVSNPADCDRTCGVIWEITP